MADRYTFRGKRLDNGEWVQGSLISFANGSKSILPSETQVFVPQGQTIIASKYCCHVDPSTVGQCTGVPDKKGKLIFDGDIVYYKFFDENARVCWKDGAAMLKFEGIIDYLHEYAEECKVISNVHDNPEMLGG